MQGREEGTEGGRGEGTAKRLYTVAFEKEIVIELQTGNQRDQEKDRGARTEGIAGKAMHGSFRNGGEGDMVSAGRGPGRGTMERSCCLNQ